MLAELHRKCPSLAQVTSGHGGEQVMFDLVVQSPVPPVDKVDEKFWPTNITGGQHLFTQEVVLDRVVDHGHAFVIGSESSAKYHTKQRLVSSANCQTPETKDPDQTTKVDNLVGQEQSKLKYTTPQVPGAAAELEPDAGELEVNRRQTYERYEKCRLKWQDLT